MANQDLKQAKNAKKDEFYTQLSDIENELKYYEKHFYGKTIFCNCDDPYESNFFKYFAMRFNQLGLKKLIATCYAGSPVADTQMSLFDDNEPIKQTRTGVPHKIIITEVTDLNGDGAINLADVECLIKNDKNVLTRLEGNGDFRSNECVELLKEADIIVTNPPFSLFREYVALLVKHKKMFLIIGNVNAITYKEVFPLIMNNQMWLGPSITSGDRKFNVPDSYPLNAAGCGTDPDGKHFIRVKGVRWFTNLDHSKRHEPLDLYKHYAAEEYPKYDNYDAVNVDKTVEIPMDYNGMMGVPITFVDKYCPEQFEIIGMAKRGAGDPALKSKTYTKDDYSNYSDLNAGPTLIDKNGNLYNTYPRILIRKK